MRFEPCLFLPRQDSQQLHSVPLLLCLTSGRGVNLILLFLLLCRYARAVRALLDDVEVNLRRLHRAQPGPQRRCGSRPCPHAVQNSMCCVTVASDLAHESSQRTCHLTSWGLHHGTQCVLRTACTCVCGKILLSQDAVTATASQVPR